MRIRPRTWFLLSLLLFAGAYCFWNYADRVGASRPVRHAPSPLPVAKVPVPVPAKVAATSKAAKPRSYHVSNTRLTELELLRSGHAILLRNALIDTERPLKLDIPEHLRARGAPGCYIVQWGRALDRGFYERLKGVGAEFVTYIPNNAALVRATPEQAERMGGDPAFQAVAAYEPYYKLATALLPAAVEQDQPQAMALNVTTYPGQRDAAVAAFKAMGAEVTGEESGPFGPTLSVVAPPDKLVAIAQMPLAQEIEPCARRRALNDLTRVTMGISADGQIGTSNYLGLSGSNVTINMNDTGVDSTHPDFKGPGGVPRLQPAGLADTSSSHGTHVAGIMIGNGSMSTNVTNLVPGSIMPGADFRGKATNAQLYVQPLDLLVGTTVAAGFKVDGSAVSDAVLESNASVNLGPTNLISNNSWGYEGVTGYDMHAASFDAATRDALPGSVGEQPLLFVFAAGDNGNGNDNGGGGAVNSITSPGTAKNVITVGAIDAARFITNGVTFDNQTTNGIFFPWTDNSDLVSWFSSCGNVGPGTEGLSGRFKPDVVAPGMFIVSCRAANYVDVSNATQVTPFGFGSQVVMPGQTNDYTLPLITAGFPDDTVDLVIQVEPNGQSPVPFPTLNILGAPTGQALAVLPQQGKNLVFLSNGLAGQAWTFGISTTNGQIQPVAYDLTFYLTETNDLGASMTNTNGYYHVISNLNSALAPYYMYQYGTSMAAAAVSGMLALVQESLRAGQQQHGVTNFTPSPALLKAFLINGSRSVNQQYDLNTQLLTTQAPGPNEQGWGLPSLPNIVHSSTNTNAISQLFGEQNPYGALATGQSQSFTIDCKDGNASNAAIRVTLVWTDPPGNPAAGIALVNDLALVVTDASGSNVWVGNDFQGGDTFTELNSGHLPDVINNAQNVYIDSTNNPIQFPLTVTVLGVRVNVNAASYQTNEIAQDYALVVSIDDAALSSPLTNIPPYTGPTYAPPPNFTSLAAETNVNGLNLLSGPLLAFAQSSVALVTIVSNAVPLLNQHAGANEPNLYGNGAMYTGGATNTNGDVGQWHFFEFDTTTNGGNVAFATFLPPDLATQIAPRTNGADLDMYVSTNPGLTNLDPLAFAGMTTNDMSVGRGGTEVVTYSNVPPDTTFYVGVKSEDQQAADFGFYAVAQTNAFSTFNQDGSITYNSSGMPVSIPDDAFGQPEAVALAFLQGRGGMGLPIRKVTVTLVIDHGNPGDLYGTFDPGQPQQVVLNNFTGPQVGDMFTNTYNDFADGFGGVNSDGPGTLRGFMGQNIPPVWLLHEADSALVQGGQISSFSVTVYPYVLPTGGTVQTLAPGQAFFSYVAVPTDAIYLTNAVTLQNGDPGTTLGIYMSTVNEAATNASDGTNLVLTPGVGLQTPGGWLFVGTNTAPIPLSGGIWYYGIYNEGAATVTFTNQIFFGYNIVPNLVQTYTNTGGWMPLTTDGTTNNSLICVSDPNLAQILDLSVGVRLADTNLDDLVLRLTSPQGSSIVLFENRGGILASNLGLTVTGTNSTNGLFTNYVYTVFTEDTNLAGVPIKFAPPPYAAAVSNPAVMVYSSGFEDTNGLFTNGQILDGWTVETNEVSVVSDPNIAHTGSNFLALANARITNTFPTIPGAAYEFIYYARSPGLISWWTADGNANDLMGLNNGTLMNGASYAAGEVGRAFSFNGGYQYDQIADSPSLRPTNGVTLECWFNANGNIAARYGNLISKPVGPATFDSWTIWFSNGVLHALTCNSSSTSPTLSYTMPTIPGVWYHTAYTFDSDTQTQALYLNGSVVDGGPANVQIGYDAHPVLLGSELDYNSLVLPFNGQIDETSIYNRSLTQAEIHAIYEAGSAGKYSTNGVLYPNFEVALDGISTNTIIITNFDATNWIAYTNSFIASNSQTTIELAGNTLGVLLDDVQLVQLAYTNYNNYYLPEEPLTPLIGQNPQGCWTLSVWDTRLDSPAPTNGALLSWTLQLTTSSTNVNLIVLTDQTNNLGQTNNLYSNSIAAGGIIWFGIDVPATANYATNLLFTNSGPMNLWFNQDALPTGTLPGDWELITLANSSITGGTNTLATVGAPPPLVPGQRYFLGVQNTGAGAETFTLQVDFDVTNNTGIIALSNGIALITNIAASGPEYYSFIVPSDAIMATFQIINASGPVYLYAREGLPVPGPLNFDYASLNAGTSDQFIVVTTNSEPVPLPSAGVNGILPIAPTTWYLSVYNPGPANNVSYTMLATYATSNAMTVIPLANGVPYTTNAPPGFPTNLVYSFTVTNTNAKAVQITETDLPTGSMELLVGEGVFPTMEDFFIGSFNTGIMNQVVFVTNTSLPNLYNTVWFVAVPNTSAINNSYSITASVITNGTPTGTPLILGASITSPTNGFSMYWGAIPGQSYTVWVSSDLIHWAALALVTAQTSTGSYSDTVPVSTQKARYYRLSTTPAPPTPSFLGASISSPTNGFSMSWNAATGQSYTIWVSTNLTNWTVATNVIAQGETGTYTEDVLVMSRKSRFFRITMP